MVGGFQEERQLLDVQLGQPGARQHQVVQCNVNVGARLNQHLNAGGGKASALRGGTTTPTGMQSSIKNFFGKEVSNIRGDFLNPKCLTSSLQNKIPFTQALKVWRT